MNNRLLIVPLMALGVLAGCSQSEEPVQPEQPTDEIQYVTPEQVGWSSVKLDSAKWFAQQSGYAAVMAAYDGKVFFSWGEVSRNFLVHSIRKPFLSSLYGMHVSRGEITLSQTLEQLGIDDIPPSLTQAEKQATIRELLQSRSGVYHEAAAEESSMIATRPQRGSHPHGTFFYYNNWDFNVAGTIFSQKTGLDIFEAFKNEIATLIGMQDFSTSNCSYYRESNKSQHPAYVFRMSARDMMRFGVLFQKGGVWLNKQIVPASWISESTTTYSVADSVLGLGYGYMWGTIPAGGLAAQMLGNSGFFHTGSGGHALILFPALKVVMVERVNTDGGMWVDPGEAGMRLRLMVLNARK